MEFKLNISRKLGINLISIIVCVLGTSVYTIIKLNSSDRKNRLIVETLQPSLRILGEMVTEINLSENYTEEWTKNQGTEEKNEVIKLHQRFSAHKTDIIELSGGWGNADKLTELLEIIAQCDSIIAQEQKILNGQYLDKMVLSDKMLELSQDIDGIRIDLVALQKDWESQVRIFQEDILSGSMLIRNISYVLIFLVVIAGLLSYFITYNNLVKPISSLKEAISALSKGKQPEIFISESNDEVGEMVVSIRELITGLKTTSNFSKSIGEGNLDAEFTPLSEDDILGNSLITMRSNLKRVAIEEQQRNWAIQGTAKFGELLRENNNNLEVLCREVITHLVKYVNANQGGFFVIMGENEKKYLELLSFYAFDRTKFAQSKIQLGEGLVGQCWQEMESIVLTDIPPDFMDIKSGLGGATPTSVLITPLIVNEEIFGVIEIASFEEIEQYKIDFVEKIGESIASTLSTVHVNIHTAKLLNESKEMAEQLQSQEEELRQNTEEMMATQEEMQKRIRMLENKLSKYE